MVVKYESGYSEVIPKKALYNKFELVYISELTLLFDVSEEDFLNKYKRVQ